MDWNLELLYVGRIMLALLCGGFIGFERKRHGLEVGIRTYAAVAVGTCSFGLISAHVPQGADITRIASGVVTGIGFIGAGVILHDKGKAVGLTSAATIWATASVGLAISFGMYILGVLTSIVLFGLLALHDLPIYKKIIGKKAATAKTPSPD
jgi:putative Mg2+ transporter-C (MgtC) family protein